MKVVVLQAKEGSSDIVTQYIIFTRILTEQVELYGRTLKAIRETIRICKDQDILKDYLTTREVEVEAIMSSFFEQEEEEAWRAYIDEIREEELTKGMAEGTKQKARNVALRMIQAEKLSDADIADYSGLTIEQVKDLRSRTTVMS